MPERQSFQKDAVVRLRIQKIVPGGFGEAWLDETRFIAPFVQAGELVEAKIRWIENEAIECGSVRIIEPAKDRVTPGCSHFGDCGGCKLQHIAYESQVQHKKQWVTEALLTTAGFQSDNLVFHRSEPYGYRIKAGFKGRRTLEGRKIGYCKHRNFQLAPITECPILIPELQSVLKSLIAEPPIFPRRTADIMVMWGMDGVAIHAPGTKAPLVRRQVDDLVYEMSVRNFFQINHYLIRTMIDEAIGDCEGGVAVDLYCGVGLYTLFLAKKFDNVIGVESNGSSVRFLKKNCLLNSIANVRILEGEVETIYPGLLHRCIEADLLVVNPPRSGMMPEARTKVIEYLKPRRIHYISCNPLTLARDIKEFIAAGYAVSRVAVMDVFPQTGHVESAVHLIKT